MRLRLWQESEELMRDYQGDRWCDGATDEARRLLTRSSFPFYRVISRVAFEVDHSISPRREPTRLMFRDDSYDFCSISDHPGSD